MLLEYRLYAVTVVGGIDKMLNWEAKGIFWQCKLLYIVDLGLSLQTLLIFFGININIL